MAEGKLKIYVTGKIEGHTKKEIRAMVENHGYAWSSTINKSLGMLVVGEKPGPKKLEKAREFKIKIVPWEQFLAGLEDRPSGDS
ncbi:MAG: BRCT domain-containing protein [Candidatus Heimdallarchaeota archaeon]